MSKGFSPDMERAYYDERFLQDAARLVDSGLLEQWEAAQTMQVDEVWLQNMASSTKKLLGVVALVYVLPVVGFLLGYFLSEGLLEGWRYGIAVAAAVLAFLPSVAYDRYARRKELLTYTILRVF